MYAYICPDPATVPERLRGICRWQRAMCAGGWLYFWPGASRDALDYGVPESCEDGLKFLPPPKRPAPHHLARQAAQDSRAWSIDLSCGDTINILPSFIQPRKLLTGGKIGDPVTDYGETVAAARRAILDAGEGQIDLTSPVMMKAARLAIKHTYAVTDEMIDWLGWHTTADAIKIILAAIKLPKQTKAQKRSLALTMAGFGDIELTEYDQAQLYDWLLAQGKVPLIGGGDG